jgi:DeoR/GlpR family transcriptional regulator of sugar metabolism
MVTHQGFCTITELATALGVSEMTVRRDIEQLATDGQVRKVHGGVTVLTQEVLNPSDFTARATQMSDAKQAIARVALNFVVPGSTICIDSGTTALEVARLLPSGRGLTVVTQSVPVITALMTRPGTHVRVMGGDLHPETQDFAGETTIEAIRRQRFDVLFLAAGGVTSRGVFCASDHEALVKRSLIEAAQRIVLIADSNKFDGPAMVRVCGLEALSQAIVDDAISEDHAGLLRSAGVPLTVASAEEHSFVYLEGR